ncbi:MAG: replicative DNA helicase [Puniceicoccales bacterium]|nr:replicative DNA helicase [Puniceicoccales bacterium]
MSAASRRRSDSPAYINPDPPPPRPAAAGGAPERVMPHNLDAEQGLLASCILNPDVLGESLGEKLRPEYFYSVQHQTIFHALAELGAANVKGVDEITLCEALRKNNAIETAGGVAYIMGLTNRIEVTAHAPYWRKIVREKYYLRRLIATATETVERAYSPEDDLQHLLDSVERRFFEISADRVSADSTQHIKEPIDEAVKLINELEANKGAITGVPTGFKVLDKLCFGFHPGQMIVVAARPGMGKTSIALNFIEAALFRKNAPPVPTLMFSLEMPSRELAMRLLCSRARANLGSIREGFVKDRLPEIVEAAGEYKGMPLHIDDQGGQTILEIRAKARRLVQKEKIGLIVIDYLQLINGTDNSVSREQQIAEASRSIKAMAKEFSLPIVALAQLNRKNEDENRPPRMSDLRESGSIEQDADMVLLIDIKRKAATKKTGSKRGGGGGDDEEPEEESPGGTVPRVLIIAKQRNGPTGEIPLNFIRNLTRFETPPEESVVNSFQGQSRPVDRPPARASSSGGGGVGEDF